MPSPHRFSDMVAREATGPGCLDHRAMVCSCGFEATSTMPSLVTQYAREHLAYMAPDAVAKRDRRAARRAAR